MERKILIAAPANCKEEMFKEYLNSLNHLIIPEGYKIEKFFVLDKGSLLKNFLSKEEYIEINKNNLQLIKNENQPKQWKKENYEFVAKLRNYILEKARNEQYDYLFSVDTDILLHPNTLTHLINCDKDLISTSIWTKLNTDLSINCAQYEGWGEYSNKKIFYTPGIYKVGWTCIAVLMKSKIFLNPNISYNQIAGVDNTGSEDYSFLLHCYCNIPNFECYISTYYPGRHLYHEKDYERWMKEKKLYE